MNSIETLCKKYALNPVRFTIKNNIKIIDTDKGRFVLKRKKGTDFNNLSAYLNSRSFNYFPNLISDLNDEYDIFEYVEDIAIPDEQRATDIMYLVSLLHNKTTYYKEIDIDEYKKIFEELNSKIDYLFNYYSDIITIIESKIYMSPSEYLLARNISKIFASLIFCKEELRNWFNLVKEKKKMRYVTTHNNLALDHLLRNDNPFLISWNKSRVDFPIFDYISLYEQGYNNLDYGELLRQYESKYPLFEEERKLLFILISIPEKIEFNNSEYELCKTINKALNKTYRSDQLLMPYYSSYKKEEKT